MFGIVSIKYHDRSVLLLLLILYRCRKWYVDDKLDHGHRSPLWELGIIVTIPITIRFYHDHYRHHHLDILFAIQLCCYVAVVLIVRFGCCTRMPLLFPNLVAHALVTRPILFCTLFLAVHHAVTTGTCLHFMMIIIRPASLALFQLIHRLCFEFLRLHTVTMCVCFTEETPNNTPFRINLTIIPIQFFVINDFFVRIRNHKVFHQDPQVQNFLQDIWVR